MLCAEEGRIYYSDIAANAVLCYDLETGREEIVLEAPDILYGVQTAGAGFIPRTIWAITCWRMGRRPMWTP